MNKLAKFEEYNIGRVRSFHLNFSEAKVFLLHDLEAEILSETLKHLKSLEIFAELETVYFKNIDSLDTNDLENSVIFTTHLNLDSEIATHQKISSWAFEHQFYQLNPYNKIAKLFDDKYMFYVLMKANDFKQAETFVVAKGQATLEDLQLKDFRKLILKPRCGTESRDTEIVDASELSLNNDIVCKILNYDDVLIQNFIEKKNEFSVLYLCGKFYSKTKIDNPNLENTLKEFTEMLEDYSRRNQVIMPHVFSLDILELDSGKLMILEANIRPAKIYSYKSPVMI